MKLKEKQKKILEVSIELFKEKGFVGASMRDLAAKLDMKAASLYAHIRSKDELLEWICFDIAESFFEEFNQVQSSTLPAQDKLNLFIEKHLIVVLRNPDITNIYYHEWKHLDASLDRFILLRKKYQDEVEVFLDKIFLELNQPLVSPKISTRFLLHTLNNSYYWYKAGELPVDQMIEEIRDRVLFGLIGKP